MSVLVKGMEMPKNCAYCSFRVVSECFDDYCAAIEALRYIDTHNGSRQDWCPLVEAPTPHGRLIDADRLDSQLEFMASIEHNQHAAPCSWSHAYVEMQSVVDDATTIIPADNDSAMEVKQNG